MSDAEYHDPFFGPLKSESGCFWLGASSISGLGDVRLRIDRDDGSLPTDVQREVFKQHRPLWPALLEPARARIGSYLREYLRPIYAEIFDEQALQEVLPVDLDGDWVRSQTSLPEIVLPSEPAGTAWTPHIAMFWECEWDPEHGIAVWFRDLQVMNVTQQVDLW